MPRDCKHRKNAIRAFRIPSESHTIQQSDWASREPHAIWYGIPTEVERVHPEGGTYGRCEVEAFDKEGHVLGTLPLPRRYSRAWIQLCYTIVYWLSTWKAWLDELGRPLRIHQQPAELVRLCIENTGTRLIKYLHIRRLIIDELLLHPMSQNESDELDLFDEYLIRDRYDWLWTDVGDIPENMLYILTLDPVHPSNEATFTWKNPKLATPPQMIAPNPSPGQTWIHGKINHFDFHACFVASFPDLVRYCRTKAYRFADDFPHGDNAQGLPDKWHEGDEPPVRFQTAEGVHAGQAEKEPIENPSTSSVQEEGSLAGPSGSANEHHGIVDNIKTREIVQLLAQSEGGIGLGEALLRLEHLLDVRFDADRWGRLLDSVHAEPGQAALMTVDEAFNFHCKEPEGGGRNTHQENMLQYRKITSNFY